MKTIILFALVIALVACGGGGHDERTVPDTCYDAVAWYPEGFAAVSYYVVPAYYVIYAYDAIYYILESELPETAFDVGSCLTAEELEALTLPRELVNEWNYIDPVLYWEWAFHCEDEDDNRGHGNDCDRDDDDNPGND
jgi:hypothetical protein